MLYNKQSFLHWTRARFMHKCLLRITDIGICYRTILTRHLYLKGLRESGWTTGIYKKSRFSHRKRLRIVYNVLTQIKPLKKKISVNRQRLPKTNAYVMKNNPFNRKSNPLIWRHVLCATGKRHPWITRTPLERPRSTLSACVHVMRSAREWKRGKWQGNFNFLKGSLDAWLQN